MSRWLPLFILLASCRCLHAEDSHEIYRRRILPLLESGQISSCTECHLQDVEMRAFLMPDPVATFAGLRARGWIDMEQPERSKLLEFVRKQGPATTPLIERVRREEEGALRAWLVSACKDPMMLSAQVHAHQDLKLPLERIRYLRSDQVLVRFVDSIWSQLGRCANCHSPDRNGQQVKKHGEQMSWIVPQQPEATLRLLVERGLIDIKDPIASELRTKPAAIVEHGGGPKFVVSSKIDQQWVEFLLQYAKAVNQQFTKLDPIPDPPRYRSWLSELQIRVTDLPNEWSGKLLTLTIHRSLPSGGWQVQPDAIGESLVHPEKHIWQNALTLFVPIDLDSKTAAKDRLSSLRVDQALPQGTYQLRLKLDEAVVATCLIQAPWPVGYQPPKILSYQAFKLP